VGVAELAGATAPEARYDATVSAAAQVSAVAVPRAAAVLQPAAPASPRARAGLVASVGAVRPEPMGGVVVGGRPLIGEPMTAGARVRLDPMTAGARPGVPMTAAVHSEAISAEPVRAASERTFGRSDPEMRDHHRMLARAGHVEPNPRR
jgi:hypothetical protein